MNSSKVMSQYLVLSTPSLYALANLDSDFIAAIAAKNCAMEWRWKGNTVQHGHHVARQLGTGNPVG